MTDAERERAAVVAWLRDRAREAMPGPTSVAMAQVINAYADCIEHGAHLKDPHP